MALSLGRHIAAANYANVNTHQALSHALCKPWAWGCPAMSLVFDIKECVYVCVERGRRCQGVQARGGGGQGRQCWGGRYHEGGQVVGGGQAAGGKVVGVRLFPPSQPAPLLPSPHLLPTACFSATAFPTAVVGGYEFKMILQ